jgi:uncharacterized protein YkwD
VPYLPRAGVAADGTKLASEVLPMTPFRRAASVLLITALSACTSSNADGPPSGDADGGGIGGGEGVDSATPGDDTDAGHPLPPVDGAMTMPDLSQPPAGSCSNIVGTRKEQVCLRWSCDRADRSEGTWSGSVASCSAGDISATGRANALKILNLYRFIADLPAVTHDATLNANAQGCALMMDANDMLSHTPPTTWKCYDATGAKTAGQSNISSAAGVLSVDMYLNDNGNDTTLGHRRWVLSNQLGPVGLGSTAGASCMVVIGGSGKATKPWMAWPPPGAFPVGALTAGGFGQSLDKTGWSLQSNTVNVNNAKIAVTDGAQSLAVTTSALGANYGSTYAIRWVPNGWTTQPGHSYTVTATGLTGAMSTISYTVDVVDCP